MWAWYNDWYSSLTNRLHGSNRWQGHGSVGSVKDSNGRYRRATAKKFSKRKKRK